jgi:DNA-binding transcriptional MerR regulator
MTYKTHLGVGLYTYPEAARIIGVKPGKLRRWVMVYRYRTNGHFRHSEPVINRYFDDEPVLTFLEVVELLFIRLFRDQGVSMPTIRRLSYHASSHVTLHLPVQWIAA